MRGPVQPGGRRGRAARLAGARRDGSVQAAFFRGRCPRAATAATRAVGRTNGPLGRRRAGFMRPAEIEADRCGRMRPRSGWSAAAGLGRPGGGHPDVRRAAWAGYDRWGDAGGTARGRFEDGLRTFRRRKCRKAPRRWRRGGSGARAPGGWSGGRAGPRRPGGGWKQAVGTDSWLNLSRAFTGTRRGREPSHRRCTRTLTDSGIRALIVNFDVSIVNFDATIAPIDARRGRVSPSSPVALPGGAPRGVFAGAATPAGGHPAGGGPAVVPAPPRRHCAARRAGRKTAPGSGSAHSRPRAGRRRSGGKTRLPWRQVRRGMVFTPRPLPPSAPAGDSVSGESETITAGRAAQAQAGLEGG